jgi:mono/diheme cytochrome c family protein
MNQNAQRLRVSGPVLLLLALLLINSLSFDGGLVRLSSQSTSAQSRRKPALVGDLFRNNCARCHGVDGRGDTPLGHTYNTPDFTDPEWWRKNVKITSTATLVSIVSRGKGGMPAFGKKLRRSDIRALVNHVRRFRKAK